MKGDVFYAETYRSGRLSGRKSSNEAEFSSYIEYDDIEEFLDDIELDQHDAFHTAFRPGQDCPYCESQGWI